MSEPLPVNVILDLSIYSKNIFHMLLNPFFCNLVIFQIQLHAYKFPPGIQAGNAGASNSHCSDCSTRINTVGSLHLPPDDSDMDGSFLAIWEPGYLKHLPHDTYRISHCNDQFFFADIRNARRKTIDLIFKVLKPEVKNAFISVIE